ncbi:hypothetical protein RUM4293_01111 [Ruegeria atlantica]|uniref:Uncharacterized protein n=1 Tax=Ruegeria atlantica TaxID=81569 RepID=A0A0P1E4I8_9RHOB|nr:hypothetical protein RUM4293_01111 [Ruegeria atlantica]
MRGWDREIEDDVDIVGCQQTFDRIRADAELLSPGLRGFHVQVRDCPDFNIVEQRRKTQIGGRDIAAPDYSDTIYLHRVLP